MRLRLLAVAVATQLLSCLPPQSARAGEGPLLLEVELNEERISRGALVRVQGSGCQVETEAIRSRLRSPPETAWTRFDHDPAGCVIDHRLGVARLSLPPAQLQPKTLTLLGTPRVLPLSTPTSSLAIDLLASLHGLRTGFILSHGPAQASLTTQPNGRLDQWTAEWVRESGTLIQLGHLVSARSSSRAPQPYLGLRMASARADLSASAQPLGDLALTRPSRIRIVNERSQELLGLTALPAGAYRLIGPTAQTHPGLLRIEIEAPDGTRQEQVLPWTQSAQLLPFGDQQWEWSVDRKGSAFGAWGFGLSEQDSLWWTAKSSDRSVSAQWVTRRRAAELWMLELGLTCPSHCSPLATGSVQASLGLGGLLTASVGSRSSPQISWNAALKPGLSLGLSHSGPHQSAQLGWSLSPVSRLSLQFSRTADRSTVSLQWMRSLDRRRTLSLTRREQLTEAQVLSQPRTPTEMGWSLRASEATQELAARQHQAWGDWGAQLSRTSQTAQVAVQAHLATRAWITAGGWQLGPIGDYNLVEIETGQPGLELVDGTGQAVQTASDGVAAFTRLPAHSEVEFRPNLRSLSFSQSAPFRSLAMRLGQKRAYRVQLAAPQAIERTYRLRGAQPPDLPALRDARGRRVYATPDGHLDIQESHVFPLQASLNDSVLACDSVPEGPALVWVDCRPSPAQ